MSELVLLKKFDLKPNGDICQCAEIGEDGGVVLLEEYLMQMGDEHSR
jgi:hypothetical protein